MRLLAALAALLAVAALAAGAWWWLGDRSEPDRPPLSAAELRWVSEASARLELAPGPACADDLPEAPSDRLEDVREQLADACEQLARSTDPEVSGADRRDAAAEARSGRAAAAALLESELVSRRPLPLAGGLFGISRVEPRLGRAASETLGRQVEVRCWSQGDWEAVVREEAAYQRRSVLAPGIGAFALPDRGALQVQSVDCGPLVRLARGNLPTSNGRRFELAQALGVFAYAFARLRAEPGAEPVCSAVWAYSDLARALGAPTEEARSLARLYVEEVGPLLPETARPSACGAVT